MTTRLPIHLVTTVSAQGDGAAEPFVHCPNLGKSISALTCFGCAHVRSVEWDLTDGGDVVCATVTVPHDPNADASSTLLHEVIDRTTTCVRPELSAVALKSLFEEKRLRAVAVVDASLNLLGLVSQGDLLSVAPFDSRTTSEVMTSRVHALPEDAPVAYAIALMSFDDVSEVPVVTERGRVIGLYRALDALRWVTKQIGYVVPKHEKVAK